MMTCSKGNKGKFIASGKEFEIVDITSSTSTIRFRYEKTTYELKDEDLKSQAEQIDKFSE
jgi:hypothetical protein